LRSAHTFLQVLIETHVNKKENSFVYICSEKFNELFHTVPLTLEMQSPNVTLQEKFPIGQIYFTKFNMQKNDFQYVQYDPSACLKTEYVKNSCYDLIKGLIFT